MLKRTIIIDKVTIFIKKAIGLALFLATLVVGFGGWYVAPVIVYNCFGVETYLLAILIGLGAWGFMLFGMIRYFEETFSGILCKR